jgi:hypothetical protein
MIKAFPPPVGEKIPADTGFQLGHLMAKQRKPAKTARLAKTGF